MPNKKRTPPPYATPPPREDEHERLEALAELAILDTPPTPEFDSLTHLAARIFRAPTVTLSFIDAERQWLKSSHRFDVQQLPRAISLCAHVVAQDAPLVIEDASADPRFAGNPLVYKQPMVRFYAGVPLRWKQRPIGVLALLDSRCRSLTKEHVEVLEDLARQAEALLAAHLLATAAAAHQQHLAAHLQELTLMRQERAALVRVLLDDMRVPLTTIRSATESLAAEVCRADADSERVLLSTAASQQLGQLAEAADHLDTLVLGVLDVDARRELCLAPIECDVRELLLDVANRVGSQVRARGVELELRVPAPLPIRVDVDLIGRVLINLIWDAAGRRGGTQRVIVGCVDADDACLTLAVDDDGADLNPVLLPHAFASSEITAGLGMGLAFCRLVVESHGGRIWIQPRSPRGSSCRFSVPLATAAP